MSSKKLILSFAMIVCTTALVFAGPGDLDPTFGTGGKVIFSGTNSDTNYRGVREFPNGQLLAFGGNGYIIARKLFADGSIDTVFGWNGNVSWNAIPQYPFIPGSAYDAEILSDGKIIVVGRAQESPRSGVFKPAMWKFNADGSIDDTFGTNGRQFLASSEGTVFEVEQWASTLVVIFDKTGGTYLGRRNLNGGYDPTFNTVGSVNISSSGATEWVTDLIVNSSGKSHVVFGGALKRYNFNGTLDTTFGVSGSAPKPTYNVCPGLPNPSYYFINSVAFGANGSLMVGGLAAGLINLSDYVYVAGSSRHLANGIVDTSYNNGTIACGGGQLAAFLTTNATQADGKVLFAAGLTKRFNSDGSQDTTYATVPETGAVDALISASSGKSLLLYSHELHRRLP